MNFNFTGTIRLGKDGKWLRTGNTKSGAEYKSINVSISTDKSNSAFIEAFGMIQDDIKTYDTDRQKITIDWADRFDDDIVKSVASYRKHTVALNGERREFISDYDFVSFLIDNIKDIENKKMTVTGQVNKNIYNGDITDRFVIQSIYEASEEAKPLLKVTGDVLWTKDDVDASDWKDENKLYINGYSLNYIDKDVKNKYTPIQLVFDAAKVNRDNDKHIALMNFKLKMMGLAEEDGKIVNNLKKKVVYKLPFILTYQNGAEEIEFDETQLTKAQREAIEIGLKTIDDFKPKGSIYGNRVTMFKVKDFDLRDDSADGCYDSGMTVDEFDDEKYIKITGTDADFIVIADDVDDDDLFG